MILIRIVSGRRAMSCARATYFGTLLRQQKTSELLLAWEARTCSSQIATSSASSRNVSIFRLTFWREYLLKAGCSPLGFFQLTPMLTQDLRVGWELLFIMDRGVIFRSNRVNPLRKLNSSCCPNRSRILTMDNTATRPKSGQL